MYQAITRRRCIEKQLARNNGVKKKSYEKKHKVQGGVAGAAKGFPLTDSLDMPFYLYNKQQSKAG